MHNGLVDALAGAELVQDPGKGGQGKDLLQVAVEIAEREGAKVGAGGGAWGGIKVGSPVCESNNSSPKSSDPLSRRRCLGELQVCRSRKPKLSRSAWKSKPSYRG
jgi:hypothetical protein